MQAVGDGCPQTHLTVGACITLAYAALLLGLLDKKGCASWVHIICILIGDTLQKAGAQGKDILKRKNLKHVTLLGIYRFISALHNTDFCCVSV